MNREDLDGARRKLWHTDGEAILTYEDTHTWLDAMGWARAWAATPAAPAPVLLQAVAGGAPEAGDAATEARRNAMNLAARLISSYEAVPVLWDGATSGATDEFDTLVSVRVFPYVYALYGDREYRKAPDGTPLAKEVWNQLKDGPMSAPALAGAIGGGITEGAILRQLRDLWTRLRVVALPAVESEGVTLWSRPDLLWPREVAQGAATAQPMALSAMVSQYLQTAIAASADEIEGMLAPCSSRSRVKQIVLALSAGRELQLVPVERTMCYAMAGGQAETMRQESDDRERETLRAAREEHAARLAAGELDPAVEEDEITTISADGEMTDVPESHAIESETGNETGAEAGSEATADAEPEGKIMSKPEVTPFRPFPKWVKPGTTRGRIPDGSRPRSAPSGDRPARPFRPREEGERSFRPHPDGDRPARPFQPRAGGDSRPPFRPSGDRPARPFTPRGDGPPRPFTPRGDGPPRSFAPRGDRPFSREGGDRPSRPWTPRGDMPGFDSRPGGDRPFRKPFSPRPGAEGGERRPWTPRPPRPEGAEGAPRERREWTPRPPREGGDRPGAGFKKPYTPREGGFSRPDGPRSGGFSSRPPRPGGFGPPRAGGFGPRRDGPAKPWQKREGDSGGGDRPFKPRPEGGWKPRPPRDGEAPRPFVKREGGLDRPKRDGDAPRREWQNRPAPGGAGRPAWKPRAEGDGAARPAWKPRPEGGAGRPSFARKGPGGPPRPFGGPGGPRRSGGPGGSRFGGPPRRFGSGGPPRRPYTPGPKPEGGAE